MVTANPLQDRTDITDLEQLLDRHGLWGVLDMLAQICDEKADHVLTNWQDRSLATAWQKNAKLIDRCSAKLENLP